MVSSCTALRPICNEFLVRPAASRLMRRRSRRSLRSGNVDPERAYLPVALGTGLPSLYWFTTTDGWIGRLVADAPGQPPSSPRADYWGLRTRFRGSHPVIGRRRRARDFCGPYPVLPRDKPCSAACPSAGGCELDPRGHRRLGACIWPVWQGERYRSGESRNCRPSAVPEDIEAACARPRNSRLHPRP